MSRKSPTQHEVTAHTRGTIPVRSYQRGYGVPQMRKRVVVKAPQSRVEGNPVTTDDIAIDTITLPVRADVLDKEFEWSERDFEDQVDRPTAFKFVIRTEDDPYRPEQIDWVEPARTLFPEMVETENDGYIVEKVDVNRDLRYEDDRVFSVTVWMQRGGLFMEGAHYWGREEKLYDLEPE